MNDMLIPAIRIFFSGKAIKHPCIANTNAYEQKSDHACFPALAGQAIRPLKINFVQMKQ